MKKISKNTWIIIVIIAILAIALIIYSGIKMTGRSMSDMSTPSFIGTTFKCANGAEGNVQAKNCRPEAYWTNYATKFCKDLCELNLDASIDNAASTDPSCTLTTFNVIGSCSGSPPSPGACFTGCTGKQCGDDGCGGSCGTCSGTDVCIDNVCQTGQCQPDCAGKTCGDDGCGGSCGTCYGNNQCINNNCQCTPNCGDGTTCGDNGCGGVCECANITICYQESANNEYPNDPAPGCALAAMGTYNLTTEGNNAYLHVTYRLPRFAQSALWKVKHGNLPEYTVPIPLSCWNISGRAIQLRMVSGVSPVQSYGQCLDLDSSQWITITSVSTTNDETVSDIAGNPLTMYDGDWSTGAVYHPGTTNGPWLDAAAQDSYGAQFGRVYEEAIIWTERYPGDFICSGGVCIPIKTSKLPL